MSRSTEILDVAKGLLSEGDNVEYDRAITEMTTELIGLPLEYKVVVAHAIGVTGASLSYIEAHQ